jgi:imidazolonepropionase-like amidohydrolase
MRIVVCAALIFSGLTFAQNVIAIRGGTVHTAVGPPLSDAVIIVRDGKIEAVGKGLTPPQGAKIYDATGKTITPGMLDEHSHVGAKPSDINDRPMVIGPQHRIMDALDLNDPDWEQALRGGVTTLTTGPGSGENVSGQAIVIKTFGSDLSRRIVNEKGGMKFAMGPKSTDRYPATAMGVAANLRQYLIRTQE